MNEDRADSAWRTACAADVDLLDRDGLDRIMVAVRLARSRLDAVEVRTARRLRALAAQGRSECPEQAIASGTGRRARDARDVADRDELCEQQPSLEDALDHGRIGGDHLDAIHAAARRLPADLRDEYLSHTDDLLVRAERVTLEQFARECRRLAAQLVASSRQGSDADELDAQRAASKVTRWVDQTTGMHHTHLELDPVRDARLDAAISRALRARRSRHQATDTPWQQLLVESTLDSVCGVEHDASPERDGADARVGRTVDRVPEITIVVDHRALLDAAGRAGLCETQDGTRLPVSTVRRMCCDAEVLPAVLGADGEILDLGRSRRTASPAQRRALRVLHATCAEPSCRIGFDSCRIHHVRHWLEHQGPSDLENLLPLCERHHHQVHEGGWSLSLDDERVATWVRPDGTIHHVGSSIDRRRPDRGDQSSRSCRRPAEPVP